MHSTAEFDSQSKPSSKQPFYRGVEASCCMSAEMATNGIRTHARKIVAILERRIALCWQRKL